MMYDMTAHLARQAAFSRATFGPAPRTEGVSDHIRKELIEVEEIPTQPEQYGGAMANGDPYPPKGDVITEWQSKQYAKQAAEWADVAILGLDGLMRAIWNANPSLSSTQVAKEAVLFIADKQSKNERRDWPDWRTADPKKAIEHIRGKED